MTLALKRGAGILRRGVAMTPLFTAAVALVLVAGFGTAQPANAQQERVCKSEQLVRTGGTARSLLLAKKRARDAWRQKAEQNLGDEWSAWYLSEDPGYDCFKQDGKNRCRASAVPCRAKTVIHGPRKVCYFYLINGTGEAASIKEWAKHKARARWADRVEEIVGSNFDTWLLGNRRKVTCKDQGDGKYVCTAQAQPCRFILIN